MNKVKSIYKTQKNPQGKVTSIYKTHNILQLKDIPSFEVVKFYLHLKIITDRLLIRKMPDKLKLGNSHY